MGDLSAKLKLYFYFLLPSLFATLITILSTVHLHMNVVSGVMPIFLSICIYYWCVYNPDFFPKWFVLAIGIFYDLIHGTPIGITSLVNLILWWMVVQQRRFLVKENFPVIWGVFIIYSFGVCLLTWILNCLYFSKIFLNTDIVLQWILSVLIYPVFHRIFNIIYFLIIENFLYVSKSK